MSVTAVVSRRGCARGVLAELRQATRFFFSPEATEDIIEHRKRVRRTFPRQLTTVVTFFTSRHTEPCAAHKMPRMLPGTPYTFLVTFPTCLLDIKVSFTKLRIEAYHVLLDYAEEMKIAAEKHCVDVWQDFHECFHAEPTRSLVAA